MGFGTNIDSAFSPQGIRAINQSGEAIPPRACVQLVPVSGTAGGEFVGQTNAAKPLTYFAADKPSALECSTIFAFNGPSEIPVDGYGVFEFAVSRPCLSLLKDDAELQDAWSIGLNPVAGQWYLDVAGALNSLGGSLFLFGGVFASFSEYSPFGFVVLRNQDLLVEITEGNPCDPLDAYTDRPIVVTRDSGIGVTALRVDDCTQCGSFAQIGDEFTAASHLLRDVHWTGNRVWVRRVGACWQIVTDGVNYWSDAILQSPCTTAGGTCLVELFDDGPIVEAESAWALDSGHEVEVMFDDQRQVFVIVSPACPPAYP